MNTLRSCRKAASDRTLGGIDCVRSQETGRGPAIFGDDTIARYAVGYTQSRKIRCDILNEVHFYSEWTKRIKSAIQIRARVLRVTCATNRKIITNPEPGDKGMW